MVGILWMVPIYSVDSWLSLSFKDAALYLDMLRDCYEVGLTCLSQLTGDEPYLT